jgi:type IV pilus assembly protein PilW
MLNRSIPGTRQRGLSLVELMVGIAVGLIVVAASTLLVTSQLTDNRRLLLETQVQQDLRATADIVARELRRSGYSQNAQDGVSNSNLPGGAVLAQRNIYLALTPPSGVSSSIEFSYRRPNDATYTYGYRLNNGVVQTNQATAQSGWQDLTDSNVLVVDQFLITQEPWTPVKLPCPLPCPVVTGQPADYCYPSIQVRSLTVKIAAHSRADPNVTRTIESRVRLRNDNLQFNPPAVPPDVPGPACPA